MGGIKTQAEDKKIRRPGYSQMSVIEQARASTQRVMFLSSTHNFSLRSSFGYGSGLNENLLMMTSSSLPSAGGWPGISHRLIRA